MKLENCHRKIHLGSFDKTTRQEVQEGEWRGEKGVAGVEGSGVWLMCTVGCGGIAGTREQPPKIYGIFYAEAGTQEKSYG